MYSRTKKMLLFLLGWLSLITGIIGIFVPLLPTTVFILIAAWCFMRSSDRFHDWMLNHPVFGPMVINWRRSGAIPPKAKALATMMILISMASVAYFVGILWLKAAIILGLCGVLGFVLSRPNQ
ncbi:MAG: YbaN family protein [Bdellovibrionaceae bacterium]|nr:YbaN family protein [Pseudobdellovibrionaceae bacterium]